MTLLHTARQFVMPTVAMPSHADQRALTLIQNAGEELRYHSSDELRGAADQLRQQVRATGRSPTEFTVTAMALVAEAIRRTLSLELYDVQVLAGLALARGAIAEMQTGEGKTLAAALPAFLFSLSGRGVHLVTTNSYLAERDWRQLAPAYELLGTSSGLLREKVLPEIKRAAYRCDITYGTGYEFGFDYLRDELSRLSRYRPRLGQRARQMLEGRSDRVVVQLQRGHALAILDEIDSVLIDEACLPLILSDEADPGAESAVGANAAYHAAQKVAEGLREPDDFQLNRQLGEIVLTERGVAHIHAQRPGHSQATLVRPWISYIENALRANSLLRCDVDYVIQHGRVLIVDEFTGRIFTDRSWRDGIHQAVEAKEGLPIRAELMTAARISRQRYFHRYARLGGMPGRAAASEREFWRMYRLPVIAVPLRIPARRTILPTRYFRDSAAKWQAIEKQIAELHSQGRPVLVGSRTIENSRELATRLQAAQIPFQLLNGCQDATEAEVVAKAGKLGAVTIATNMAGRGTDIRLDARAISLGGMHLIGAERNESARIDRQLLGRVARQGEPGSCQFYVSGEDSILSEHAPDLGLRLQQAPSVDGEINIDFSKEISRMQSRAEASACQVRRKLWAHDHWLDEVLSTLAKE